MPLSEKEASNAEVQLARDKVTNGEWGGIGNGIALSYYGHSLLLYLLKLWGLGQSPIRPKAYKIISGIFLISASLMKVFLRELQQRMFVVIY